MELLIRLLRVTARLHTHTGSAVLAAFCCLILTPGMAAAAEADSLEYAVKATYLYKFGIYVEWPGTTFSNPSTALNLCLVGDDPFGSTLDTAVSGQRVDGRAIVVRRLKTVGRDSGCHILYIGNSETQRTNQVIEAIRGSGVLTVSDSRGTSVGIINFVIKDNRVRFNIDEDAAAQNGLVISSKLLGLALSVKPRQNKEGR